MKRQPGFSFQHGVRAAVFVAAATVFISASSTAFAASFDCARASQPDEKTVCASRSLSEMDVEMSVRFQMMMGLVAMGQRGDMGEAQQAWLKRRHACGANRACLQSAYQARIQTLKDAYADLAKRGPF
jgi:uncharacterized protein